MISPFGVDHGISKSFTRMAPKLSQALRSVDPAKSTNMAQKLRHHAGTTRLSQGQWGQQGSMARSGFPRMMAADDKKASQAYASGAMNSTKKKRYLP